MASTYLQRLQRAAAVKSLRLSLFAFQLLPRRLMQGFLALLFPCIYLGLRKLALICSMNLQHVYGDTWSAHEYKSIVRECFWQMGCAMMDMLYFVKRPDELKKITCVQGEEHLQQALAQHRGVVAVTAHLGNFPLMFVSLVSLGYKVNVVIRTMRDQAFSQFITELCDIWGIRLIETEPQKRFIKDAYRVLRDNELLVVLLDEVVPLPEGVVVPFLGTQVARATGPMLFHERLGSEIVPLFIVRDANQHFRITIEPMLHIEKRFDVQKNLQVNIAHITNITERHIRHHPTQWGGWLNKRWIAQAALKTNAPKPISAGQ